MSIFPRDQNFQRHFYVDKHSKELRIIVSATIDCVIIIRCFTQTVSLNPYNDPVKQILLYGCYKNKEAEAEVRGAQVTCQVTSQVMT